MECRPLAFQDAAISDPFALGLAPDRAGRDRADDPAERRLHPAHQQADGRILRADPALRRRHDADGPGHRSHHPLPGAGDLLAGPLHSDRDLPQETRVALKPA